MTSITYYNLGLKDHCLIQDSCMVCYEAVVPGQGKAHAPSNLGWLGLWKRPVLFHPIHDTCLEVWKTTQLNNQHIFTCPTCREPVVGFKEKLITSFGKLSIPLLRTINITTLITTVVAFNEWNFRNEKSLVPIIGVLCLEGVVLSSWIALENELRTLAASQDLMEWEEGQDSIEINLEEIEI